MHHFIQGLETLMNAYSVLRSFTFIFALLFIYDFVTSSSSQGVLEDSSNALEAGKQYFLAGPFLYFHSSVEHGLDSSGIERQNFEGSSEN